MAAIERKMFTFIAKRTAICTAFVEPTSHSHRGSPWVFAETDIALGCRAPYRKRTTKLLFNEKKMEPAIPFRLVAKDGSEFRFKGFARSFETLDVNNGRLVLTINGPVTFKE